MYSETSAQRIKEDIFMIDNSLKERVPSQARSLLSILMRTYDGILMSLNTAMLPTESPIYGHNFDELKNYDENVFSNLTVIRNKLQLFDLQFQNVLEKNLEAGNTGYLSQNEIINAIKVCKNVDAKEKEDALKMAEILKDIAEGDNLGFQAKWERIKPVFAYLADANPNLGSLVMELLKRMA
ncbi:MAG TPA: hypothetical protein P5042_02580 [Candidatus Izemoplasmatales bacterium]|nr:hypothetical protein [Candidatus Izemoplasmatales bacterium]